MINNNTPHQSTAHNGQLPAGPDEVARMAEDASRDFGRFLESKSDAEVDALIDRIMADSTMVAERKAARRATAVIVAIIAVVAFVVMGLTSAVYGAEVAEGSTVCTTRTLTGRTESFLGGQGPWSLGTVSGATAIEVLSSDGYANRRNVTQLGEIVDFRVDGATVLLTTDVPDPRDADAASIVSSASFAPMSGELTFRHARPASEGPNSVKVPTIKVTECVTVAPPTTVPPTTVPPTTVPEVPVTSTTVPEVPVTSTPPATVCPDGSTISSLDECDSVPTPEVPVTTVPTPAEPEVPTTTTTVTTTIIVGGCAILPDGSTDCPTAPVECPRATAEVDGGLVVAPVAGVPSCPVACPTGVAPVLRPSLDGRTVALCSEVPTMLPATGSTVGALLALAAVSLLAGAGFIAIARSRRSA